MSYANSEQLRKFIGETGLFFNDGNDLSDLRFGVLKEVSKNGNCLDGNDVYFDEFVPKTIENVIKNNQVKSKISYSNGDQTLNKTFNSLAEFMEFKEEMGYAFIIDSPSPFIQDEKNCEIVIEVCN